MVMLVAVQVTVMVLLMVDGTMDDTRCTVDEGL